MYREALARAAESRGWFVHWYDRERVFRDAAALGREDVEAFLSAIGRSIGHPGKPNTSLRPTRRLRPSPLRVIYGTGSLKHFRISG